MLANRKLSPYICIKLIRKRKRERKLLIYNRRKEIKTMNTLNYIGYIAEGGYEAGSFVNGLVLPMRKV